MASTLLLLCLTLFVADESPAVTGIVQDEDGRPVAEAEVWLQTYNFTGIESDQKLASVKTNAKGEFSIRSMESNQKQPAGRLLVVAKPGWTFGGQFLQPNQLAEQITVTLYKSSRMTLRVRDPSGQALPKASVMLQGLAVDDKGYVALGQVGKKFEQSTNADGEAELTGIREGKGVFLLVTAAGFGAQRVSVAAATDKADVTLSKVGRVQGKLTAPDPEAIKGQQVIVQVNIQSPDGFARVGSANVKTNDKGEFEIPEILAGNGQVYLPKPDSRFQAAPQAVVVKAGETTKVELKLTAALRLVGVCRDHESKKPVPGVSVYSYGSGSSDSAVSDKEGKFQLKVTPGVCQISMNQVPAAYIQPINAYRQLTIPADFKDGQELPDAVFELQRGATISGSVADAAGKPVAGASVSATWQHREGHMSTMRSKTATSNATGEFTLEGLGQGAALLVTAQTDLAATLDTVKFAVTSKEPLRLTVSPDGLVRISGRIIDEQKNGIGRVKLQLIAQQKDEHGNVMSNAVIALPGGLSTDADGRFTIPKGLLRSSSLQVQTEADGFLKSTISLVVPKSGEPTHQIADIVLQRLATVTGRVLEVHGRPVPGATVSALGVIGGRNYSQTQPMATSETDADGRFQLLNVNPTARFVYADRSGHRFTGTLIPSEPSREVELRLVLIDTPDTEPLKPIKNRMTPEQRKSRLRELRKQVDSLPQANEFKHLRDEVLVRSIGVDDEWVEQRLETITAPRSLIPLLIKRMQVEDAAELAQQEPDPYQRLFLLNQVYDALTDNAAKKELLAQALVGVRTIQNPAHRVVALGIVAEKLYDLGDKKTAEQIVKETLPVARQLAPSEWNGYARCHFAETLCFFDLDAALAIVNEMKTDSEFDRHIGNVAHELANVRPADAERVLAMCRTGSAFDRYAIRVCYRMATVDLDRAMELAETIGQPRKDSTAGASEARDPNDRAFAFAVMAHALAKSAADKAKTLLRQAAESLNATKQSGIHADPRSTQNVALRIVGWSETIDPDSTREYLWRALHALDATQPVDYRSGEEVRWKRHRLGNDLRLLCRYGLFPEESRRWLNTILPAADDFAKSSPHRELASVIAVWTLLAPDQALAWHEQLIQVGNKPNSNVLRIYPQPTTIIAHALSGDEDALCDFIERWSVGLWIPDTEDL